MKKSNWLKSVILLIIVFVTSIAYATAISGVQTIADLTLPLLFNGIAPGAIIFFVGKRYLSKQDAINTELIRCKNLHETKIGGIEMIHKIKGCDQPETATRSRRKGDR